MTPLSLSLSVGMDLDGCHYRFDHAWWKAAVKLGALDPGTSYVPATRWGFYETYGVDVAGFLDVCHAAADAGILWGNAPMDLAGLTVWRQLEREHQLHVVTDRLFGASPSVSEDATRDWLTRYDLGYASITFTADKTSGPLLDVHLDDKIENYDALDATGCEVWLFDQPWNADNGERRRVYNHIEFWRRVKAHSERVARVDA